MVVHEGIPACYPYTSTCIHLHTYIHIHLHVYIYTRIYIYSYMYTSTHVYPYTYIHTHICIHTYIYIERERERTGTTEKGREKEWQDRVNYHRERERNFFLDSDREFFLTDSDLSRCVSLCIYGHIVFLSLYVCIKSLCLSMYIWTDKIDSDWLGPSRFSKEYGLTKFQRSWLRWSWRSPPIKTPAAHPTLPLQLYTDLVCQNRNIYTSTYIHTYIDVEI